MKSTLNSLSALLMSLLVIASPFSVSSAQAEETPNFTKTPPPSTTAPAQTQAQAPAPKKSKQKKSKKVSKAKTQQTTPAITATQSPAANEPSSVQKESDTEVTLKALLSKTETLAVNLEAVIKLVEDQNLFIAGSKENERVFKAHYRVTQSALLPDIGGVYNQNRFQGAIQIFGGQTTSIFRTTVQPQLGISWTLYPGGTNIYQMLAAKKRTEGAQTQIRETLQQQLSVAVDEFYQVIEAQVEREIASKSIEEVQKQVELSDAKLKAGVGTKLDVARTKTLLVRRENDLIYADNKFAQSEQNLLNRLNLDVQVSLIVPLNIDNPQELKRNLVPETLPVSEMVAHAVRKHPSLERFNQDLQAMGIDYKVIRSEFIPSVTLNSFINGTGPRYADLGLTRFGGLAVNVNFLNSMGLNIPLRMREKKAEIAKRVIEKQVLLRNIETSVVKAYLDSRSFSSAIQTAREELDLANETYRLAVGRYQAGIGINLDVVDAELALFNARNNLARNILEYNRAQVHLLEAMGEISSESLLNGWKGSQIQ